MTVNITTMNSLVLNATLKAIGIGPVVSLPNAMKLQLFLSQNP